MFKKMSLILLLLMPFILKAQLSQEIQCQVCYLYIYGTYTNYEGEKPTFVIDRVKTTSGLSYGETNVLESADRVRITIPNINITPNQNVIDTQNKYSFDTSNIIIEEFKNNKRWARQDEFEQSKALLENKLAISLVLDMSSSLGNDVNKVKADAINFCRKFLDSTSANPSSQKAEISLVLFSKNVVTFPFTADLGTLQRNIDSFKSYDKYSKLYEAMESGIQALDGNSQKFENKVMVTFTDGGDNFTNDPTSVRNRIIPSRYQKYVIGLKGKGDDFEEAQLEELASVSGNYIEADDVDDLQASYNNIYNKLYTTATVIYDRTAQKFNKNYDNPVKVRFGMLIRKR